MSLKAELSNWDGRSAEEIGEIYLRRHNSKSFVFDFVSLLKVEHHQIGASWLLKRHLEEGYVLDLQMISTVYSLLEKLQDWESKLHILQCLPHLPIGDDDKETLEEFIRKCLSDKNKFVRAWAYGGFYLLADRFPEYRAEAKQFVDAAMINEPASVKARIRNVTKKGFLANEG